MEKPALKLSEPKRIPIPVSNTGTGRELGEFSKRLAALEVGEMIEVEGATQGQVNSTANSAGKREGKKFAVRKLNKVAQGKPVYGVWRTL